jgi:hypothetical protein
VWVQPEKWSNQYSLYGKNFFDPHTGAISTEAKFFYGVADAWHPISKTSERYWFCDYYVPESQTIKIYVWDKFAQGNINDPLNCSFDTSIIYFNCHFYYPAISGTIRTKKNMNPIQSMNLKASYDEGYFTYLSKMDGTYEITCNPNEEYKITCSKDSDYMNGVTTLDLILINRHILGIKPITDPFKLIASDANNSKSITSADILEIRNLILGNINKFKNHSWIGLKPNFTFANPLNPFPELENASTIVVQMKNSNIQNIDFQGIKIGDINYNALENRNMNKYSFILDNIQLEKDIGYRIPIFSKNFINVNGFQFALDISGFSGFEIENGAISFDHHDYNIIDNKFIVSYINPGGITINNDEVLFTLLIKANEKINLNAKLKFDEKIMPSELYVVNSDEVTDLQLEYRTVDFEVHQNEPNPFTYETEIKFYLTKLSEFDLKVFDINGREIYCKKSIGNEGMNSIILNKDILKTSGTYFYKLVAGDNTAAKKMMFLN